VASISNPRHYVNVAREIARVINAQYGGDGVRAAFMDQFENLANVTEHARSTGPEIWRQVRRAIGDSAGIDAFVMSAGTGGTLSGVTLALRHLSPRPVRMVLADPPGSSLHGAVAYGAAYAPEQAERVLRRSRADTVVEGVGLDRTTANFRAGAASADAAIRVTDQDTVDAAHALLGTEGLFVGSSSAMNVAAAMQVLREMDAEDAGAGGKVVVTVICDVGGRHLTRFWNRDFIVGRGLRWPGDMNRKKGDGQEMGEQQL